MNKKFLAILAVSAAAFGSSIIAAPAQAQVAQEVDVKVSIQPTIYLRTFKTIDLTITPGELGVKDKDYMGDTGLIGSATTTGKDTDLIDRTKPLLGKANSSTIIKKIKELYAVWSNSGKPVNVAVTSVINDTDTSTTVLKNTTTPTQQITLKTVTATGQITGTPTSSVPLVGGVDLEFDVTGAAAGNYDGAKLRVEAKAQL
jgi:hypothetical protein